MSPSAQARISSVRRGCSGQGHGRSSNSARVTPDTETADGAHESIGTGQDLRIAVKSGCWHLLEIGGSAGAAIDGGEKTTKSQDLILPYARHSGGRFSRDPGVESF